MIGIISYLPEHNKLRTTRKQISEQQIDLLHNMFPNETLTVVAQNYAQNDYLSHPYINYLKYKDGIGPAKARNVLLDLFYNSNDEILFFMDDDILIYDYYDIKQLITDFYNGTRYQDLDIDVIISSSPIVKPFKNDLYNKYDCSNYHILRRSSMSTALHMTLFKNLYQKYGKKFFFDEQIDLFSNEAVPEDCMFVCELILNDVKVYRCLNWIEKNIGFDKSTLYNEEEHYDEHKRNNVNMAKLLEKRGLSVKKVTESNKALNVLLLKRPSKYIFPDNLIPKNSTKNNLF